MNVYHAGGICRVYSLQDARRLREQHRICGTLTGTLPQVAQQNVFLGLPLALLPEEVQLLVRQEVITLIDDEHAHVAASPAQVASFEEDRRRDIVRQQDARMQAQREKATAIKRGMQRQPAHDRLVLDDGLEDKAPPIAPFDSQSQPYNIDIPTETSFEWHEVAASVIPSAQEVAPLQVARNRVFADLWRRGMYMGGGLRFGGDHLVYPGDPMRYHSHFTTTILPDVDAPISALSLVALGRLATAVKKAHLLCAPSRSHRNGEDEEAEYLTLEWAAM